MWTDVEVERSMARPSFGLSSMFPSTTSPSRLALPGLSPTVPQGPALSVAASTPSRARLYVDRYWAMSQDDRKEFLKLYLGPVRGGPAPRVVDVAPSSSREVVLSDGRTSGFWRAVERERDRGRRPKYRFTASLDGLPVAELIRSEAFSSRKARLQLACGQTIRAVRASKRALTMTLMRPAKSVNPKELSVRQTLALDLLGPPNSITPRAIVWEGVQALPAGTLLTYNTEQEQQSDAPRLEAARPITRDIKAPRGAIGPSGESRIVDLETSLPDPPVTTAPKRKAPHIPAAAPRRRPRAAPRFETLRSFAELARRLQGAPSGGIAGKINGCEVTLLHVLPEETKCAVRVRFHRNAELFSRGFMAHLNFDEDDTATVALSFDGFRQWEAAAK